MNNHPLVRALKAIEPEAVFTLISSREWRSMTFAGQQLVIERVAASTANFEQLARSLPNHEFSLPKMLVADISVAVSGDAEGARMLIEALIIDE